MQRRRMISDAIALLLTGVLVSGIGVGAQVVAAHTSLPGDEKDKGFVHLVGPETATIAAGKPAVVELHFRVNEGLHINSHTPREQSLIATRLAIPDDAKIKVSAVDFPAGTDYAFSFDPQHKLSVYTGEFVLKAHVVAQAGTHELQGVLRYQACDNASCYPPKTVAISVPVTAK